MTNEQRLQLMRDRLTEHLAPNHLEIIDDSAQHVGHAAAQTGAGYYTVVIHSEQFADQSSLSCHRLIYAALGNLMDHEIHALRIQLVKK